MIEKLKLLLKISADDSSQDETLAYCLESVEDAVKNYCNRPDIPPQLKSTVVRMAAGYYAACGFNAQSNGAETENMNMNIGTVTKIERGDTTISYESGDAATAADKAAGGGGGIMELLNDYRAQLNRFRRIRW